MSRRYGGVYTTIIAATAAFTLTLAAADPAAAQRGGGRQGGGFGQGGPGGRFGGQRMGPPAPTLATIPVTAMVPYFGLTAEQAKRIEEIQRSARPDRDAIRAQFEELRNQGGQNATPADRENIRARMMAMRQEMMAQAQKTQEAQERAVREIELVLTPEQRPAVASFLRDVELFRSVDLPLELIRPLDLNGPQKRKLQNIAQQAEQERMQQMEQMRATLRQNFEQGGPGGQSGQGGDPEARRQQMQQFGQQFGQQIGETMRTAREKTREKVMAALTPAQQALVTQWEKDHPEAQRGFNRGGFGPGGPGGPGGFRGPGG
jgi:Spy/CpxP family protein refolding chaperone